MTVEEPPPVPGSRRAVVAASCIGFLGLVAALAVLFGLASRADQQQQGYLAYVETSDAPIVVVVDPPAETQMPYTVSHVIGGAVSIAVSVPGEQAGTLVLSAIALAGLDPETAKVARSISTGSRPDGTPNTYISLSLVTDAGYQEFLGVGTDGSVLWNDPPITTLPADLTPGTSWDGDGLTNAFAPFTYKGEVLDSLQLQSPPGPLPSLDGCLDVKTRVDQEVPEGDGFVIARVTTWCPGWGSVASRLEVGGVFTRLGSPGEVDWPSVTFAPPLPQPPGTQQAFPMSVAAISRPPLTGDAGLVVVNDIQGDLVAFTAGAPPEDGSPPRSQVTWMQHAGGQVLGVAGDDDQVFVTSSQRALLSFDEAGRLQWSTLLPDAAVGSPAVLGGVVAVAVIDGTLRGFDAATGVPAWTVRLSDVVTESPVATSQGFIAADSAGYIVSVGADGAVRWAGSLSSVDGPLSALPDGSVLVPQSVGTLTLLSAEGAERWSMTPEDGSQVSPAVQWGEVLAVPTDAGILGLALDSGELRWVIGTQTNAYLQPGGLVAGAGQVLKVAADGSTEVIADVREVDGSEPQALYLAQLGEEWVAVTWYGAMTFLGSLDG